MDISSLISRIWFFISILFMIFIGIYILIGLNLLLNFPDLNPNNIFELISFLSPLLILILIVYLKKHDDLDFSSKDNSIVYLKRTAYLPDTEIKLVVYECDIKGIAIVNSLLALLEFFPITAILHPITNHVFFIFYGSELNILRKNCQKGEIYLKNVFSEVKRLEKDELIDFLDFFYNEELTNLNSGRLCISYTSMELSEAANQFSPANSADYNNNASFSNNKYLSDVKESEYCIFVFRNSGLKNDIHSSDLQEMTNQTLYFSNIVIQRLKTNRLETNFSNESNLVIDYRNVLLNGFNPEKTVEIDTFANFLGMLRILDTENDKLIDESNNSFQNENEMENITLKLNPSIKFEEHVSIQELEVQNGKKIDKNHVSDLNDSFLRFKGQFCDICSKFSDLNESLKRIKCCIPNLTFSYDKLLDSENLPKMMLLKQESLDKFLDYTSSFLERCSVTQVICFFNVLCFSDQFSRCMNKTEKVEIIQYLTSFLSDQNDLIGNKCHQGLEEATNTI